MFVLEVTLLSNKIRKKWVYLMAKLPYKVIIDIAKTQGPKALKALKDNKEILSEAVPLVGRSAAKIKNIYDDKKKLSTAKEHYRKTRYVKYKNDILIKLADHNKLQLVEYKSEVESFIAQIENEETEELRLKKPLHSKRIDEWNKILIQIVDKMKIIDYKEYLQIFNNPDYTSSYFEGYNRKLTTYKKLIKEDNIEKIHDFIFVQTEKPRQLIEKDFV